MARPGRTIGLALAIIVSVMLFSIIPLVSVGIVLLLQARARQIEFLAGGGAIGGDISGLSNTMLVIQVIMGVAFLIVAVLAWRGRPASIRFTFVGAVVVVTIVTIVLTLASLNTTPSIQNGLDSSAPLANSLLRARIIGSVLVALYVIWYVNRGPARAFYRGYYLEAPTAESIEGTP